MNTHKLKIYPEHYNNVRAGTKTFEIRNNDRAFQKGDMVELYYWDRDGQSGSIYKYTGIETTELVFKIGDVYPIDSEKVVFSLLEIEEKK